MAFAWLIVDVTGKVTATLTWGAPDPPTHVPIPIPPSGKAVRVSAPVGRSIGFEHARDPRWDGAVVRIEGRPWHGEEDVFDVVENSSATEELKPREGITTLTAHLDGPWRSKARRTIRRPHPTHPE